MRKLQLTVFAIAMGLAFGAAAATHAMSKSEYTAAKKTIEADYKGLKAGCEPMLANAKDICNAEANGKHQVALAELEAAYKPSDKTRYNWGVAKADAVYAVDKEKCDELAGNAKDVCVKEADAKHVAAKADAKAHMKVVAATKDAAGDKRDAEYAVAKEKCDALAGSSKDTCVSEAKARFGKS
jgi:hypothetical protein